MHLAILHVNAWCKPFGISAITEWRSYWGRYVLASILCFQLWPSIAGAASPARYASAAQPPELQLYIPTLNAIAISFNGDIAIAVGESGTIIRRKKLSDKKVIWEKVASGITSADLEGVVIASDERRGWIVGCEGTILRSENVESGHWESVSGIPVNYDIQSIACTTDGNRRWAAGVNGVLYSDDHEGRVWRLMPQLPDGSPKSICCSPDGSQVWVLDYVDNVYRFTEANGGLWEKCGRVPPGKIAPSYSGHARQISCLDNKCAFVCGLFSLWKTLDGGATWEEFENNTKSTFNFYGIASAPERNELLVVGSRIREDGDKDAAAYYCSNASENGAHAKFRGPSDMSSTWKGCAISRTSGELIIVGERGKILHIEPKTNDWHFEEVTGSWMGIAVNVACAADGGRAWCASHNGVFFYDRKSAFFSKVLDGNIVSVSCSEDGKEILCLTSDLKILRAQDDKGKRWQEECDLRKMGGAESPTRLGLKVCARGGIAWAFDDDHLWLSDLNKGGSWKEVLGDKDQKSYLTSIACSEDGTAIWAISFTGTILYSRDAGRTWIRNDSRTVNEPNLHAIACTSRGEIAWIVGERGTVIRVEGGETLKSTEIATPTHDDLLSVWCSSDGGQIWAAGKNGALIRTVDDEGLQWFEAKISNEATKGAELNSLAFSAAGDFGYATGLTGEFFATTRPTRIPPKLASEPIFHEKNTHFGKEVSMEFHIDEKYHNPNGVRLHVRLTGGNATGDLKTTRVLEGDSQIEPWYSPPLNDGIYTCHIDLFDGWNVSHETVEFRIGDSNWRKWRHMMGWNSEAIWKPAEFIKEYGTKNAAFTALAYACIIAALYIFWPYGLVVWHEKWADGIGRLPALGGGPCSKVAELAVLFLIPSGRCLNAFVKRHQAVAVQSFQNYGEVSRRPKWVAAPLRIAGEEYGTIQNPYDRSRATSKRGRYIRGFSEIRQMAVGKRRWISIEGPGGIGKSSLAFQIARWYSVGLETVMHSYPQALPVLIRNPLPGLDAQAQAELRRALGEKSLSPVLVGALLRTGRILVVVDGISELNARWNDLTAGPLDPYTQARDTRFAVFTSRKNLDVPEVLQIHPLAIDLGAIDVVLNRYVDDSIGAGRFLPAQRELIRESIKIMLTEVETTATQSPSIPMIFMRLLVERANDALPDGTSTADECRVDKNGLPKSFSELVDAYINQLFERNEDKVEVFSKARRASMVCVGKKGLPHWRAISAFSTGNLGRADVDALVESGLMIDNGEDSDPHYKFALDPIAECLAAKEYVLGYRDGKITESDLVIQWAGIDSDSDMKRYIIRAALEVNVTLPSGLAMDR